jgi:two-component system, NarL family, response regulator DevR
MNDHRVAYSSRHGGTAEMAEWIARAGTGPVAGQIEAKGQVTFGRVQGLESTHDPARALHLRRLERRRYRADARRHGLRCTADLREQPCIPHDHQQTPTVPYGHPQTGDSATKTSDDRGNRPHMASPHESEPSMTSDQTAQHQAIRVFLLDDHEVVRQGLRALVEADGSIEVVGESGSAREATSRIPALRPDVAILDGRLPDGSGVDVCRDVRSVDPTIACLILTSYDDDEALFNAIMAGASGYVLKQIHGSDLVDAIHRVAQGQSLLDPQLTARVLTRLREGPASDPALDQLTQQERRILALIAEGLTNRQIGERLFLAEKTVKNYVSSLLAKLGMERRTQAAVYASHLQPQHPRST